MGMRKAFPCTRHFIPIRNMSFVHCVSRRRPPASSAYQLFSRHVHIYNASSTATTVLQVVPAVMEAGRGVQLSFPVGGGGVGGNRELIVLDAESRERRQVAAWANANGGNGNEPPPIPPSPKLSPARGQCTWSRIL